MVQQWAEFCIPGNNRYRNETSCERPIVGNSLIWVLLTAS